MKIKIKIHNNWIEMHVGQEKREKINTKILLFICELCYCIKLYQSFIATMSECQAHEKEIYIRIVNIYICIYIYIIQI